MPTNRWLREPLLHFLLAGALLFAAFAAFRDDGGGGDESTIVVDRRGLLTYLQYRANAFEPEIFGAALDAMSDAEIAEVVDAFVSEEILYREAKAYGLEASDNIIRQRMVQKMRFLLTDVAAGGQAIDPAALDAYFADNIEAYAIAPWATFTHVFFDADRRGADGARAAAEAALAELNQSTAGFNDAPAYGDRFPFLRNYVERTLDYIASHFGFEFSAALERLDPDEARWQGPIRSAYGEHLVLLTRRAERGYPALDEVRADVERDLLNQRASEAVTEMTRAMRERYRIEVRELRAAPAE